jgi:DNA-binding transcriptional LysR family regulator
MADAAVVQEGLVVRPGDSLVVRVSPSTGVKQIRELLEQLRARFPGVEVTVVAAEQLAVLRGG